MSRVDNFYTSGFFSPWDRRAFKQKESIQESDEETCAPKAKSQELACEATGYETGSIWEYGRVRPLTDFHIYTANSCTSICIPPAQRHVELISANAVYIHQTDAPDDENT